LQNCFEADRSALVLQLEEVAHAVEDSATEMAMTTAERVFDPQVSKILVGEVKAMRRMVRGLKGLRLEVARAHLPETGN